MRLEGGYMSDRYGGCPVVGLGGGLSVRLTPKLSLRGGVKTCAHCWDGAGPAVGFVGVEARW